MELETLLTRYIPSFLKQRNNIEFVIKENEACPYSPDTMVDRCVKLNREGFLASVAGRLSLYKYLRPTELLNLAEGAVKIINLTFDEDLDLLFFLDKSGRPGGHLFIQTWNRIFPDIRKPDVRYIEIGRVRRRDEEEEKIEDIIPEVHKRYSSLSGKRIGVIDDHVDKGNTIRRATRIIRRLFPEATAVYPSGMFAEIPSWYGKISELGIVEQGSMVAEGQHFLVKPFPVNETDLYPVTRETVRNDTVGLRSELSNFSEYIAANTFQS